MVIAISRESGCGGHEIAVRCAHKKGIPLYDKKTIRELAEKRGLRTDLPEFSDDDTPIVPALLGVMGDDRRSLKAMMHELAVKGDCVVVGRCGDLLADMPDVEMLSFFIHADLDVKIARLMERKGLSPEQARRRIERIDRSRKLYFEHFAHKNWRSCRSYNFSLDSGFLGLNACVDAILHLSENGLRITQCFD